jgi:DNA-binding response OmpR family regulator
MDVRTFHDGSGINEFLQKEAISVLLLEINLPDRDGLDVIKQLHNSHREIPVIFLTALSDEHSKAKGFDAAVDDFVTKAWSVIESHLVQIIVKNGNVFTIKWKELGILKHFSSNDNRI